MNLQAGGFDWDDGNRTKCQKHGVSIAEIEGLFVHGPGIAPDPKHSADEDPINCGRENKRGKASIRGIHAAHDEWSPPDPPGDRSVYACQGDCSL